MSVTDSERDLLRAAARQELARRRLLPFGQAVLPWFECPRHIQYLGDLLERVERGEIRRLAISAPPGHGKSSLLQAFVAWFIGRDPRRRALVLSASERLARRNSRGIRGMVQSEEWPWPDVMLPTEAIDEWETNDGGGVRSIGQTGTVTGFRAECILCDDVQPDAGSETTRESLEEWFRGVLSTRLEPGGVCVVIQTRWHDDDLIGRLQQGASAGQWMFVNLPAIAGENDLLGRASGEALWPERWPLDALALKKDEVTANSGSGAFSAQYMGDPVPAGGRIFNPEWFTRRHRDLPFGLWRVMAIDGAWKTGLHNDRSAISTWGTTQLAYYLCDVWAGRLEFPALCEVIKQKYLELKPRVVLCEEAASGYAILQQLRMSTNIPIIGIAPRGAKESRAEAITPLFESGRISLPEHAPWLADWLDEHSRFPAAKHDDLVDTTSLALGYLHERVTKALADREWERQNRHVLENWMAR